MRIADQRGVIATNNGSVQCRANARIGLGAYNHKMPNA